jgi:exo-beta-1,3-glucanase (GH17 family)
MIIDSSRARVRRALRWLAAAAACAALSACGQNQNWSQSPSFVTIGGTVSNLTGTLVINDNSADPLTVSKNGPFTFALQLASGASYSVAITGQPTGQVCTLANASGTTTSNVTNIAISCANVYTIGGTIANLNGSIVLQNNGQNSLSVSGSGASTPFTFLQPVASNGAYAVTIQTQPAGQSCTITGGASGNATANVTSVAISCEDFTLRPLPAIYKTGKAINYSPYRAGGPNVGEIVSDANIKQDLQLLVAAGYNLIRLFGGDANSESVVRVANTTPGLQSLRFHAGSYLEGAPSSCVDTVNATDIAKLIHMANTYPNIVAVSVGNETSFAANLPVACLVKYIQQVRAAVTQPVTADDDASFYTGVSSSGERPDTVLAAIDFVAYHAYPFTFELSQWNWQQLSIDLNLGANGATDRATAMMNGSIAQLQSQFTKLQNYPYRSSSGAMTTIGATLPLVLTETGWKYKPTNNDPIELVLTPAIANPVNAKWYADLLASYLQGNVKAPENIFLFEAFNETWKGNDAGWGLWDENRTPLYALCGTAVPLAPLCSSPIYMGAGYDH